MNIQECELLVELLAAGKTNEVDSLLQSNGFADDVLKESLLQQQNVGSNEFIYFLLFLQPSQQHHLV